MTIKLTLFRIALGASWLLYFNVSAGFGQGQDTTNQGKLLKTEDIYIRDPFVYADEQNKTYYLYAQMSRQQPDGTTQRGVQVYTSQNLQVWAGPFPVFEIPSDFWAQSAVWAPEVHRYRNQYYLFVTFTAADSLLTDGRKLPKRGTQVLVADSPRGPFRPFANRPHTPLDWVTLDGTLFIQNGRPWLVFCHEWLQVTDGTLDMIRLKKNLSATKGKPMLLFKATAAPWVKGLKEAVGSPQQGYVTDGPFFYRTQDKKLLMIWSSFGEQRYAIGQAVSASGKLKGPWQQIAEPLFKANGGHGMIFQTFDNQLMLVLHQPNTHPNERMKFFPLREQNNLLHLVNQP
jgi:GH43 family beta-xylosidase